MSETAAIVGIYGTIDRAVQVDWEARARVAQVLRQYRNPSVHWYDEFEDWVAGAPGESDGESHFPGIADALSDLAANGASGRTLARRMFAIVLAKRVFPEMHAEGVGLREPAIRALRAPDGEGSELVEPEGLYELLAGEGAAGYAAVPDGREWWKELIATAVSRQLIPNAIGMFPQPCSGRLLSVPGIAGPVAVLKTEHETEPREVAFDAAIRFLEPVNWEMCMPDFWCDMDLVRGSHLPPGQRRYHEVVSTHCHDKGQRGFWAETELSFDFMWLPGHTKAKAAVANYQLAPGRPLPGDRIVVDEGTLLVEKVGRTSKLKITTTKRVKFNYPFMTEALALIMCALGYADFSGGLLCCAARHGRKFTGTDFPGVPPTAHTAAAAAAGARESRSSFGESRPGGLAQEAGEIWARSLRDWANAIERGGGSIRPAKPAQAPRQRE